jgi:hypothetical protein
LDIGKRVLLLHTYPPTPCLYPFEKGLRRLGFDVVAAGPTAAYGDPEQFARLEPDCRYIEVDGDIHIDALFERTGGVPDWVLYLQPGVGFLPRGLRDCPVPTVGWLTEEYKFADIDQRLYYYFDVAPTSFPHIERLYRERGYDHRVCCNFIFCNWLTPDPRPEPRTVDVGFIGMIDPELSRERCRELERLLLLRREGVNVVARSGVFLMDMLDFYANSKIVFQHSGQGPNNLTFRISEAMAAGALVISGRPEDVGDLVGRQLVEGEHIVYYDSWRQAEELIRHYTTNEQERARIAEAGRRLILEEFPWHKQIEYFVDTCVRTIPDDFLRRRSDRLARFGVDHRQECEDYARYFLLAGGNASAARRRIEEIDGWQTDASLLSDHALTAAAGTDGRRYGHDRDTALTLRPSHILVHFNEAAFAFRGRATLTASAVANAIRRGLAALDALDVDTVDPRELDGLYNCPTMTRFRQELTTVFFDTMDQTARVRRLLELYRYELYRTMGILYCEDEQWQKAIVPLSSALRLIADDGYTARYLAQAFERTGRLGDAEAQYRHAISVEAMFYEARLNLTSLLIRLGRKDEALQLATETAAIASPWPLELAQWQFHVGRLHDESGREDAARQALRESLAALDGIADTEGSSRSQEVREVRVAVTTLLGAMDAR